MNPNTAAPAARPQPGPGYYVRKGIKAIASLQLTVVLFALSIGLIFFGTVAQMDYGIWTVVDKYFWSWAVWVPLDLFAKVGVVFFGLPPDTHWGVSFPYPAGKLLGGAMLLNLLAAHLVRFRITWKRSGVLLIHGGLILLFVGEFITREYAVEQRMTIEEGETVNFTEDSRNFELAFIDRSDPVADQVTAIPSRRLRRADGRITHPDLPVDVEVVKYMVNSALAKPGPDRPNPATAGHAVFPGQERVAVEQSEVSGVDPNQRMDIPSAYVTLYEKGTDKALGTYLVSLWLKDDSVTVGGKAYDLSFRFARYYKPYALKLLEFRHDKYVGTNKPRNFSSKVRVTDEEQPGFEREVVISMNNPLRYRGETFYQADWNKATEKGTVLQVVKNPGWLIPYVSCVVVTLGLVVHFGIYLSQFLLRRAAA
jgi:hypothetical protein